jgi:hypothetical protein
MPLDHERPAGDGQFLLDRETIEAVHGLDNRDRRCGSQGVARPQHIVDD